MVETIPVQTGGSLLEASHRSDAPMPTGSFLQEDATLLLTAGFWGDLPPLKRPPRTLASTSVFFFLFSFFDIGQKINFKSWESLF